MLPSLGTLTVAFPRLGHRELTWESSQFKSNAKRGNRTMDTHLAAKSGGQGRGREGQDKKWAGTQALLTCGGVFFSREPRLATLETINRLPG